MFSVKPLQNIGNCIPLGRSNSRGKITMGGVMQQKHFVATHGVGHGSWVYYKLKPRIEAAGHRFTPVDLAASGVNEKKLEEVLTLDEYTTPLLEVLASIPENEKVVLIGHSGGGMAAAVGMEKYPEKIAVAVFLNAIMPDSKNRPSYVLEQYSAKTPLDAWLDTQFSTYGCPPITSLLVGPKFISSSLYHLSTVEDQALGALLMRPGSLFIEDLLKADNFTDAKFGSVPRVFVLASEDRVIPPEFQRWMIENNPVKEVKEIKGSDHMPMFSRPDELCQCLVEIAKTYA
ncbi:salicylic acid-binding 2-like [Olea europaea subsp. europaea]|uniref:Salicylic acid-binding 2-like n=1 Tax=Olea europaea subsp. europaea TaxID=158383 RepID=A0A8S0R840_OLEEU|nr:salicylic acid-binding 2-like [Olea europaea subsp. europaea]